MLEPIEDKSKEKVNIQAIIRQCQLDLLKAVSSYENLFNDDTTKLSKQRAWDIVNLKGIIRKEYKNIENLLDAVSVYVSEIFTGLKIFGFWVYESHNSRLRNQYINPVIDAYSNPIVKNILNTIVDGKKAVQPETKDREPKKDKLKENFAAFWQQSIKRADTISLQYDEKLRQKHEKAVLEMASLKFTRKEVLETLTTEDDVCKLKRTSSVPEIMKRK